MVSWPYTVVVEMSPTAPSQLDSGDQPCDILTLGRGWRHDCTTDLNWGMYSAYEDGMVWVFRRRRKSHV